MVDFVPLRWPEVANKASRELSLNHQQNPARLLEAGHVTGKLIVRVKEG